MLRSIIVAGLVVASGSAYSAPFPSHPDSKTTAKYTFKNNCDGLTLTQSSKGTATGHHTGCTENDDAGGVRAAIGGKTVWVIMTTSVGDGPGETMYVLDEKALTWTGYIMETGSVKFQEVNSGKLVVGAPTAGVIATMKPSIGAIAKQ